MRQRAAWSLSNVISALCDHDAEGNEAPAASLQEFAVATCATVRKSLNDNDKVTLIILHVTCYHIAPELFFFLLLFACLL